MPSLTAWATAAHRAVHQVLEEGRIFSDPLAVRILGQDSQAAAQDAAAHPSRLGMRLFIAARTRFAEDSLAAAVEQGVRQLVVLGAGLDTYAYRGPYAQRLHIFEVDHPATQTWKRERLAEAAIAIPPALTFAPIDLERQTLPEGLGAAGFDPAQQTFFTWLGVVPYLTEDAIWSTLNFIAGLPNGAQVVFDYSDPPHTLSPEQRAYHDRRAARVESLGESWVTYFEAENLREKLLAIGFSEVEDLGPPQIAARYIPDSPSANRERGGHVLRASTIKLRPASI
ncbi:MAG: SAM-dependent methyltransferase [Candidatus Acidiferrum sp.]